MLFSVIQVAFFLVFFDLVHVILPTQERQILEGVSHSVYYHSILDMVFDLLVMSYEIYYANMQCVQLRIPIGILVSFVLSTLRALIQQGYDSSFQLHHFEMVNRVLLSVFQDLVLDTMKSKIDSRTCFPGQFLSLLGICCEF